MPKKTIALWDDTLQAIAAIQQAHDEWLALAAQLDPDLSTLERWSVSDVVNSMIREYGPKVVSDFRLTTEALKRERGKLIAELRQEQTEREP